MINFSEFISKPKGMVIAPAGYGKTHTIAECLKHTQGKQIILTHTHGGVTSIKEKIKKENISSELFHIETITSYAQKYVKAFYCGTDIPEQENSNEYYKFIIEKATHLVQLKPIADIIQTTFSGLFVDEYQDCTLSQHQFILCLSNLLPTRILGDHLQGIFNFQGSPLADLSNGDHMGDFLNNRFELNEPWRWIVGNNNPLGIALKEIREKLETNQAVDLSQFPSIETVIIQTADLYNPMNEYYRRISNLRGETSLLIIHPISTNIEVRKKIVSLFNNSFSLIEAIDDKDFYGHARLFDSSDSVTIKENVITVCNELFNKSELGNWFTEKSIKNKRSEEDKRLIAPVIEYFNLLEQNQSSRLISNTLKKISTLPKIKCYRKELFYTICRVLEDSEINKKTVYESMVNKRNQTRRIGRKIFGRCVGTTLLTKGLEFDTVVVLDAHNFKDPKNLYVALTRASKRLIVFTENTILTPFGDA